MAQLGKAGIALEPVEQRVDTLAGTGNGTVDALVGEQQRALDIETLHFGEQRLAQGFEVVESDELIQRRDYDRGIA